MNSEIGQWPCPITIYIVKRCKQQNWKDLQARHQQVRDQLSAHQLRIIRRGENRRELGHVPQLFLHASVVPKVAPPFRLVSLPHDTVGAPFLCGPHFRPTYLTDCRCRFFQGQLANHQQRLVVGNERMCFFTGASVCWPRLSAQQP
jgi:hypothetical protein